MSEIWGDVSNLSVLFSNVLFLSSDLSLTVLCCFRFYFCRIYLILDLKKIGFNNYIRQVLSSAWGGGSIFFLLGGGSIIDHTWFKIFIHLKLCSDVHESIVLAAQKFHDPLTYNN